MRRLEQLFGFPLFVRSTRAVELTDAAEKILPVVRTILEASQQLSELTREIREAAENNVRIGAPSMTALWRERQELFAKLETRLKKVSLEFIGLPPHKQLNALRHREIDVSFHVDHVLDDYDEFDRLVFQRLPYVLLVNEKSALAKAKTISKKVLRHQPIVLFGREHSPVLFDQLVDVLGNQSGADLIVPTDGHPLLIALHAAKNNMAAVHLDWLLHGSQIPHGLVQRSFSEPAVFVEMSLVRLRTRQHKPAVDSLWAAGKHQLKIS